ncbi:hypothetical protein ACFPRL_31575 [Pseudoclavibacter helvolus]
MVRDVAVRWHGRRLLHVLHFWLRDWLRDVLSRQQTPRRGGLRAKPRRGSEEGGCRTAWSQRNTEARVHLLGQFSPCS